MFKKECYLTLCRRIVGVFPLSSCDIVKFELNIYKQIKTDHHKQIEISC